MSAVLPAQVNIEPTCLHADNAWRAALAAGEAQERTVTGAHLSIGVTVMRRGEATTSSEAPMGEEVATVLEGDFRVDAAGESYELSPGEGIVIPPREPRVWTCLTERGALYRVITRLDNLPPKLP